MKSKEIFPESERNNAFGNGASYLENKYLLALEALKQAEMENEMLIKHNLHLKDVNSIETFQKENKEKYNDILKYCENNYAESFEHGKTLYYKYVEVALKMALDL